MEMKVSGIMEKLCKDTTQNPVCIGISMVKSETGKQKGVLVQFLKIRDLIKNGNDMQCPKEKEQRGTL